MISKSLKATALLVIMILIFHSSAISFQDAENSENTEDQSGDVKMPFGTVGFGWNGMTAGFGFRYAFAGASFSIAGLAKSIPVYVYPDTYRPFPTKNYTDENYLNYCVSIDLMYFYDIKNFSLFGSVGYTSEKDSVLRRDNNTQMLFFYTSSSKSSISLGIGVRYKLADNISVGLGLHSVNGVYLQLGYFWY